MQFDNSLGRGTYHTIYFGEFRIGFGDLHPARPLRLHSQRPAPVLELHCLLAGQCASQLAGPAQEVVFRGGEANLLFLPGRGGSQHVVQPEQPCQEFEIHFPAAVLARLQQASASPLAALTQGMERGTPALLQAQHLPISRAMHELMRQIRECPLQGVARCFFLESKALELLALLLEQASAPVPTPPGQRLRRPDMEKLHAARQLLLSHLSKPPTLAQLATQCGLNEFKLKNGFRQLFGDTVYGFVLRRRLELARQHLQAGDMTVAEIAEHVGYRHASHFTAAFKKKYGVLPKDLRGEAGPASPRTRAVNA